MLDCLYATEQNSQIFIGLYTHNRIVATAPAAATGQISP